MDVQYIRDINGNIAFAVVPIDIWEDMTSQTMSSYVSELDVAYVKSQKEVKKEFNPDDFLGVMSYPLEFLDCEIHKMRGEWDRGF
jgi:hypothetical protein